MIIFDKIIFPLLKKINFKVVNTKMHVRILLEMVADPFGTAQQNLETADLDELLYNLLLYFDVWPPNEPTTNVVVVHH
jgi:hypothetical protein